MINPMKLLIPIISASLLLSPHMSKADYIVTWETLGNTTDPSTQAPCATFRFTVSGEQPFERLAFNMFKRDIKPVCDLDTVIELFPGYFAVGSPRFAVAKPGEPIVVDVMVDGGLSNISFAPDAMHIVANGQSVRAKNIRRPLIQSPDQWRIPGRPDGMIYGDQAWVINDSLRTAFRPAPYKNIPTPKNVEYTGAYVATPKEIDVSRVIDNRHDYYRVEIGNDGVLRMTTNSSRPQVLAAQVMARVVAAADAQGLVPAAVIEDWADLPFRALMIDVSRNFTDISGMKKIIALMASYGLNTLHFHLGDDEGWRLEIPEIPELTAVGSRRGYTVTDDAPFLKQIYSGDGNPESTDTPANGHYTVDEYVDLLQYADSLGVEVIPEFDTPAHSRAAIRATEYIYITTGDDSLRLVEEGDTSVYTSAQDYHDNIMNPALDGPYRLWDMVFGSLKRIYARAGVPLKTVHIGGDEVPPHAWDGSREVQKLKIEKGLKDQREVHAYFNRKVTDIAAAHGLRIAGWQEIALDHGEEYDSHVRPHVTAVDCWTNAGDYGKRIAENGYPVVLANVDYLYFDQIPTTHPEEQGLTWGGIVDEFRPLHATVDALCPSDSAVQANVIGISGKLFAETVRSIAMVERYILPRLLGLAERAHNVRPTLTDSEYFGALTGEMARWAENGTNFYVRQPGIRVAQCGKIEMNDAYGMGEIRYTLDGSQPTRESRLYTGPLDAAGAKRVDARLFIGPAESVTSILFLEK